MKKGEEVKTNTKIALGSTLIIIILSIAYCLVVTTFEHTAYECSSESTKVKLLGEHRVTFVVVDIHSHPYLNVLIEIRSENNGVHNVTREDGSCSFILEGDTKYFVNVWNKSLEPEKTFDLYPVNSCYTIII